jgi:hypothetical protein
MAGMSQIRLQKSGWSEGSSPKSLSNRAGNLACVWQAASGQRLGMLSSALGTSAIVDQAI